MAGIDYVFPGFTDATNYFERTWNQFQAAYRNFMSVSGSFTADDWALKRAADIASGTAEGVRSAIDTVRGWGDSLGLNGLGIIQAIPWIGVAAVTAASASLAYLIPKMQDAYYRYSLVQGGQLDAGTAFPRQTGVFESTSNIVKWVVIGAAIYFLAPVVMKQIEKK